MGAIRLPLECRKSIQTGGFSRFPQESQSLQPMSRSYWTECSELRQHLGFSINVSNQQEAEWACQLSMLSHLDEYRKMGWCKKICSLSTHFLKFSFHALLKNNLSKILSRASASDSETWQNQPGWRLCWSWSVCSVQKSKLTYDAQFCAGKNDAMSVFCYTLIHAGVRQADVRYRERALLELNSAL